MAEDDGPRVDLSAVSQQNLNDVDVSTGRCLTQRSVVRDIAMFLVGALRQQQLHHLHTHTHLMTTTGGGMAQW